MLSVCCCVEALQVADLVMVMPQTVGDGAEARGTMSAKKEGGPRTTETTKNRRSTPNARAEDLLHRYVGKKNEYGRIRSFRTVQFVDTKYNQNEDDC